MDLKDIVTNKITEIAQSLESGISPMTASEELVRLTSLFSTLNAAITKAHFALNVKKSELLKDSKSVAHMRILAEASTEWRDFVELANHREALLELIRAVKYYLKAAGDEYREGQS